VAASVDPFWPTGQAAGDGPAPREITVAGDNGVGVTVFEGLVGIESRVNATVDDPCAALARYAANLVSA
jgi:hypothetical protein